MKKLFCVILCTFIGVISAQELKTETSELYELCKHLLTHDSQIVQVAASAEKLSNSHSGSFEFQFGAAKVVVDATQKNVSLYEIISPLISVNIKYVSPSYIFTFDEMAAIKKYINENKAHGLVKK
ncbi:MAG: hypothetical protein AMXMBFR12_08820 [Candidatus Babeliales bacterium]